MYTAEYDEDQGVWKILDPDFDWIFSVATEGEKDAALSHLNRGMQ